VQHSSERRGPILAPGELIENINKRSESSNRKYRAFKNFLKQQTLNNNSGTLGTGGVGLTGSTKI